MNEIKGKGNQAWWNVYLIPITIALVIGFFVAGEVNSIVQSYAKLDMNSYNWSNYLSFITSPSKVLEVASGVGTLSDENALFTIFSMGVISTIILTGIVMPIACSRFVGKYGLKSLIAIVAAFAVPLLIRTDARLAAVVLVFTSVVLLFLYFAMRKVDDAFFSIGVVCAGFGAAIVAALLLSGLLFNMDPFKIVFYNIPAALGPGFSLTSRIDANIPYVSGQNAADMVSNSMIALLFVYICYVGAISFFSAQKGARDTGKLGFNYVKFSSWTLPNSFIIAMFAIGFGSMLLGSSANSMFGTVSDIAFLIFIAAFTIQAISLLTFLTIRFKSPIPLILGLVLAFVPLFSSIGLPLLGVMDQTTKIRKRLMSAEKIARQSIGKKDDQNGAITQEEMQEFLEKIARENDSDFSENEKREDESNDDEKRDDR